VLDPHLTLHGLRFLYELNRGEPPADGQAALPQDERLLPTEGPQP
jgi:hypothetical protein